MRRILLSWSTGENSAGAVQRLRSDPSVQEVGLLPTINLRVRRVSMHVLRESVLDAQEQGGFVGCDPLPAGQTMPCTEGS